MTRDEVDTWLSGVIESGIMSFHSVCGNCRNSPTMLLFASVSKPDKYQRACQLIKEGTVSFKPQYHKVETMTLGYPVNNYTLMGGDIEIREAFCSRKCFFDYIYEHQGELIELITQ